MSETLLNILQWPAMVATLWSTWLVASQKKIHRSIGFWIFILSNIMWVLWGLDSKAYAVILMQIGLFFLNIRGLYKNRD